MKILLIGASGTIGAAVETALKPEHTVISANFSGGDVQVDLGNTESINAMFNSVGKVDAVISTAGLASFAALNELTEADYQLALQNKLMGQINLIRIGQQFVNTGGSVTLTSGVLSREPMHGSSVISMANGALESFVKAAALELDTLRVNVVAPIFVKETMAMMGMDTTSGLSAADTANAYVAAVTGDMSGKTLDAPGFV
ncbi:Short-chain dehydrogenase/reductase SDR [Shewanella piezotolerans WP3]|uniref:Short-chain dehydrogenase/reductase SDR n=1 Tax=Shewanella piezotolerans (strain WP3 / JCM 13877) TaxID=225849 RepID=B8CU96_SHEPW|nr:short chain dehydrogenase [Shewanella piezotolerans]ACJ30952.1 Short-chain dehydrogenase/reductase SDR [Shewanella piezotolerans WP3]